MNVPIFFSIYGFIVYYFWFSVVHFHSNCCTISGKHFYLESHVVCFAFKKLLSVELFYLLCNGLYSNILVSSLFMNGREFNK